MSVWEARAGSEASSFGIGGELRREMERLAVAAARDRGVLDAILNHSNEGVLVLDASGHLRLVNRAAERIFAGSATDEGAPGSARYRAFHPDGRPLATEEWSMARSLRTGEPVEAEEVDIERLDGTRAVILMGAAPIVGGAGQIAGAVGIFTDITPFKERERERLQRQRRAATQLLRLQALTAALSESLTAQDVARVAVEHVRSALGARDGGLWTVREDGVADLVVEVGFTPEQRLRCAVVSRDSPGPLGDVLREPEPVWIESRAALEARYPGILPDASQMRAVVCLPLKVKGHSIGAMSFTFAADGVFSEDDRSFLLVAVRHGALALERARLYEAEHRARAEAVASGERASFLYEASSLLASSLQYETTLASVAELAVPRVADWCSVDLAEDVDRGRGPVAMAHVDPGKVEVARELGRRYPPLPGAPAGAAAVIRSGRPELYREIPDPPVATQDAPHVGIARELGLRSAMVVPMLTRGRTLGAITFARADHARCYDAADLEMAEHLARRAGLAIDNARLYEQAQVSVRAREDAVAVVSHDLKNPLNAILMSSGLLRRAAADPDRVRHHAETIERSVQRMRSLVGGLLDLARLEAGRLSLDRQPADLGALVNEALGVVQPLAQARQLLVQADCETQGALAVCDRERVLQVLSNLVGNAIAFTPPGGRVTVRARASGPEIVVSVADTGPGIPEDHQRLIFDRFWKSRSSGQGSGLGLSIAKGIVEAHGGRIWVESSPGEGATFLFTLPAG